MGVYEVERFKAVVDQDEIHRMAQSKNVEERIEAAYELFSNFTVLSDKKQAWNDLIRLTQDGEINVGWGAADPLGRVFAYVHDKIQAQNDLHRLIQDDENFGRWEVAIALGGAFAYVPDKDQAWNDLQRLTKDELRSVRTFANYSLGKASIFKATEVENKEDIKRELETAIKFFEKSNEDVFLFRPARFCLPFYRAYHAITFKEQSAEAEVLKYLEDVKIAVDGSECKEKLIEVIKYLEEALRKAQKSKNLNELINNINDIFKPDPKNLNSPRIQTVHISDTQNEIVRIAVIQFCYELTKSFPLVIENKDVVKAKIFSGLKIAKDNDANIACLPELCLCEEWIPEIEKEYPEMIIIGGGFYKDNRNICPLITKSDLEIFHQSKVTPAPSEDPEMSDNGMISGDRIYIYETRFGRFVILICRDFERFAHYFRESDIDFIFCPSFNDANDRFHIEADNHVTKVPSYILIANTGIYGGSAIFAQLNKNYFNRLVGDGCKKDGDMSFKLCEVKQGEDGVIITNFNLNHKSIQIPTPSESSKEIRSVSHIKKHPIH